MQSTVSVELTGLGGPWLPTPGDPEAVSDRNAAVDRESGTLYDGDAGSGTATTSPPPPTPRSGGAAGGDRPGGGPRRPTSSSRAADRSGDLRREDHPGRELALRAGAGDRARRRQLAPAVRRATSGSAFWRIEQFLFGEPGTPGARVGTSEQFATAFALLARGAGLPTRVVVGFRPGDGRPTAPWWSAAATRWPGPRSTSTGSAGCPSAPPPTTTPSTAADPSRRHRVADPGAGDPPPDEGDRRAARGADARAAAPAPAADRPLGPRRRARPPSVVVLVLLVLLLRRLRSFRHLRRGAPGAWAEVFDALALAGHPADRTQPATVVADAADHRFGTRGARRSPTWPSAPRSARLSTPAARPDRRVRSALQEVRRAARASVPAWRRWWWWLDPRVLPRG